MNHWITGSMNEWKKIGNTFEWLSFGSNHMDSIHRRLNTTIERWRWPRKQNKNLSGWNRITVSCLSSTCSNYYITETFIISSCHRFIISGWCSFSSQFLSQYDNSNSNNPPTSTSTQTLTQVATRTSVSSLSSLISFSILDSQFELSFINYIIEILIFLFSFDFIVALKYHLCFLLFKFHFISFPSIPSVFTISNVFLTLWIFKMIWTLLLEFGWNWLSILAWIFWNEWEWRTKNEEYSRNEM
jgi:hypothetical protein